MVEASQVAWTRSSGSQFHLASPLGQPRLPEKARRCMVGRPWPAQSPTSRSGSLPASTVCRRLLGSLSHPLQVVNAESIETATQAVPTLPLGREGCLGFARAVDSENSKACGGWREAGWSYLREGGLSTHCPAPQRGIGVS